MYVYKVASRYFLDNWVELFSIYLLTLRNEVAIIVILQVKVLSSPSKKELKNVTSISYSVVESPHVTRGKKKDSVRKPRKNRRRSDVQNS